MNQYACLGKMGERILIIIFNAINHACKNKYFSIFITDIRLIFLFGKIL